MKRLASFLLVFCLLLSTKMFAQTAAQAYWDLSSNTGAAVTGNIMADSMYWTAPLTLKDFTGGALSGPAIRLYDSTGWGGGVETGPVLSRYIQFLVSPKAGYNLHVDSISFWLGCYGTHGGMHAAVYWDTDTTNFSMNNLLDYDSASYGAIKGLPDVRDGAAGMPHDTSFTINTDVNNGGLFAFRVYPWYNAGSASTSKYVVMWVVYIYGTTSPATGVKNETVVPKKFVLHQNYPNPFNPSTTISFSLAKTGYTNLTVYNLLGQKIATLINGNMTSGFHSLSFNASTLNSGIYFYKLTSGNQTAVKKFILMK